MGKDQTSLKLVMSIIMMEENLIYNLIYIIYYFNKKNDNKIITCAQLRAINVRLHSMKYCYKNFASGKNVFSE